MLKHNSYLPQYGFSDTPWAVLPWAALREGYSLNDFALTDESTYDILLK